MFTITRKGRTTSFDVQAGLYCATSNTVTSHLVNTVTGEAECTGCATVQVLEPAEVDSLLVDA